MPNKSTDQQMIWAAQISYFNFTDAEVQTWKQDYEEYPTVRELLLNRAKVYENGYITKCGPLFYTRSARPSSLSASPLLYFLKNTLALGKYVAVLWSA